MRQLLCSVSTTLNNRSLGAEEKEEVLSIAFGYLEIPEFVNLRPAMLDNALWFKPFIETWTREKLLWTTTSAVHSFETLPKEEDYTSLIEEYAKQASKPTL
ncbi:hypothetical protein GNF10_21200 [Nostoc sp. UCD121]|uniref:hypothetical protein n=1 Tax=unclassified Nostoc TaxID=2593658 RepID=UPI001623E3C8|nr:MULTISPECIES: hypothetical protein [unclassified Nostoc]MBC1222706.1 hypothetical protein [Nostoc sp. UCD120]MBC1278411.1 hypothetical protein [Nostoc sp. UCD121]MBC1299876.1 hypothetical protein [Nostoc sp. UCD122]